MKSGVLDVEDKSLLVIFPEQAVLLLVLFVRNRVVAALLRAFVLAAALWLGQMGVLEFLLCDDGVVPDLVPVFLEFQLEQVGRVRVVEVHPELHENLVEIVVLFLHFLVVAAALFSLPSAYEVGHAFEDLVGPAEVLEDEVSVVNLEEPVIQFVFLAAPVPLLRVLELLLGLLQLQAAVLLLRLLLVLLARQPDVALLAEQRLEVVAGNHLLIVG